MVCGFTSTPIVVLKDIGFFLIIEFFIPILKLSKNTIKNIYVR